MNVVADGKSKTYGDFRRPGDRGEQVFSGERPSRALARCEDRGKNRDEYVDGSIVVRIVVII